MSITASETALDADDRRFLEAAFRFGRRNQGLTWPNPCVAALIVARDETGRPRIVGRGVTALGGRPHAERLALDAAGAAARGATCYVTLEPCSHHGRTPPCSDALIESGVTRVVSALDDPDARVRGRGHERLRAAGIEVVTNAARDLGAETHLGHITRVRDQRPSVTLKLAVSADGMIGRTGAGQVAITGAEARAQVQMQRALHDAVMIGIGTAIADDPQLTVRLPGLEERSPTRVILDSSLRLWAASRLVERINDAPVWVYTVPAPGASEARAARRHMLCEAGAQVVEVQADPRGRPDLAAVMRDLATRGLTQIYVEGGAGLAAALLDADLIDRFVLFRGPEVVGTGGVPALGRTELDALLASRFVSDDDGVFGADRMEVYKRAPIALDDHTGLRDVKKQFQGQ